MDVRPLKTEGDYDWALAEIERYFDTKPSPGTPEADRYDVLADLIAAYEDRCHPISAASPVDVIEAYMNDHALGTEALDDVVGSSRLATGFLERRYPLTLDAIRRINAAWRIPADLLIQSYSLQDIAMQAGE